MNDVTYLGWYDNNKHRTQQQRLDHAIETFELRRGYRPAVVLVNPGQLDGLTAPVGVTLYSAPSVAADTFYLAHERVTVETAPSQTMLWEVR